MPNDQIVWTKSGSGTHGNTDQRAQVPEYGTPQPVLDTDTNTMTSFGVQFPEKRGTHPFDQGTADFMPEGGTIPGDSSDVSDQGA